MNVLLKKLNLHTVTLHKKTNQNNNTTHPYSGHLGDYWVNSCLFTLTGLNTSINCHLKSKSLHGAKAWVNTSRIEALVLLFVSTLLKTLKRQKNNFFDWVHAWFFFFNLKDEIHTENVILFSNLKENLYLVTNRYQSMTIKEKISFYLTVKSLNYRILLCHCIKILNDVTGSNYSVTLQRQRHLELLVFLQQSVVLPG